MTDNDLIMEMMLEAWANGDTARALYLHDTYYLEQSPLLKFDYEAFLEKKYAELHDVDVQGSQENM